MKFVPVRVIVVVAATLGAALLSPRDVAAQRKGRQAVPVEVVVPNLGLKLVPFEGKRNDGSPITGSAVSAVQEGSTAYFARIQPGDRILQLGVLGVVPPQQIAAHLNRPYKRGAPIDVSIDYLVTATGYRSAYVVRVYYEEPGQGRWITTTLVHNAPKFPQRQTLPGWAEAQAAMKQQYDQRFEQVLAEIGASPCTADSEALAVPLAIVGAKAGLEPSGIESTLWTTAQNACRNQTDGVLPDFEATIVAMNLRMMDPCAYDGSATFAPALAQARNRVTRHDYVAMGLAGAAAGLKARESTPDRGARLGRGRRDYNPCFLDFVEASLTGRPYQPSSSSSPPDDTPAQQPNAPTSDPRAKRGPPADSAAAASPRRQPEIPDAAPSTPAEQPSDRRTAATSAAVAPDVAPSPHVHVATGETRPPEPAGAASTPSRGSLSWSGQVRRGEILAISGSLVSSGALQGELPGMPVSIQIATDKFQVVEIPSLGNQWRGLKLQALEAFRGSFVIEWARR